MTTEEAKTDTRPLPELDSQQVKALRDLILLAQQRLAEEANGAGPAIADGPAAPRG